MNRILSLMIAIGLMSGLTPLSAHAVLPSGCPNDSFSAQIAEKEFNEGIQPKAEDLSGIWISTGLTDKKGTRFSCEGIRGIESPYHWQLIFGKAKDGSLVVSQQIEEWNATLMTVHNSLNSIYFDHNSQLSLECRLVQSYPDFLICSKREAETPLGVFIGAAVEFRRMQNEH